MNSDSEIAFADTLSDDHEAVPVVAAFADIEHARTAAQALHDEGFHRTWIGVTHPTADKDDADDTTGEATRVDNDEKASVAVKVGRFLNGERDGMSLYQSLRRHGVADGEAMRIDNALEPNDVLLVVNGSNHPELAAQIMEDGNGDILSGGYAGSETFSREQRLAPGGFNELREERLKTAYAPSLREESFTTRYDED
jgi:hypothetical protein